ncbi:MAG TPA: thermonuclease family protein, partial [Roseiflexaceae bacterium]
MQIITRLWRSGKVGKAGVGFVVLLLGCCVLGALGSLLNPSTTRQPAANQPPVTQSVAVVVTAQPTEPPLATARPAPSATAAPPTRAPSAIPTAPSALSPAPTSSPTLSPPPTAPPEPSPTASPSSDEAGAPASPAAAPGGPASIAQPEGLPSAAVVEVIDGDTVDVRLNGAVVRIRLIGIDTPEVVDPRRPVECFGREASTRAHELLDGQTVALEADPSQDDRDRYGRSLRYLWLPDGRLFNLEMIAQ